MSFARRWLRRLDYLLHREKHETAMRREMEAHRAEMPDPRHFGSILKLQEEARDVWGWNWLDNTTRDIRLASRSLRRTPGFTIATITVLSLGLAFVATTFTVTNAYLIRPLPYPEAERLYHLSYAPPGPWEPNNVGELDWTPLRDVVDATIIGRGENWFIGEAGHTAAARQLAGSQGFFEGLGVRPAKGRLFTPEEFAPGAARVALIGDQLWRTRFGSDPSIVGKEFRAELDEPGGDATTYRIVGVLPPGFWFGRESSALIDVLTPLAEQHRPYLVRLAPGVTPATAEQRITAAVRSVATDIPPDWTGVHLESMRDRYSSSLRPQIIGPTIAALLVLLIVSANVAVLSLLRVMARQKELGIRIALGATGSNILRLLATETLLLAIAAISIGLTLTTLALGALTPVIEAQLGRPAPRGAGSLTFDGTVLLVVGGAAVIIALGLALLPALLPWQRKLSDALRGGGQGGGDSPTMRRARSLLITLEVTGSLVLLAGCASLVGTVGSMLSTNLGFSTTQLARARVFAPVRSYSDTALVRAFQQRIAERVGATLNTPVAFSSWPPFAENPPGPFEFDDGVVDERGAATMSVGSDYFSLLEIPVQQGRAFNPSDNAASEPVAIVSSSLAAARWPGASPLGHRIRLRRLNSADRASEWRTIVGVVGDVRQSYHDADLREIYVPFRQEAAGRYATFYFRSTIPDAQLLTRVQEIVAESDPLAVVRGANYVATEDKELAGLRFITIILSAFALFAVLLALLGVYAVIAYAARAREREIAIRIAIGASRQSVVALFLRSGGKVLVAGVCGGLLAAWFAGRLIASQVTTIKPFGALSLAFAGGFLLLTGLMAVWWPARRASRTDPVTILKDR